MINYKPVSISKASFAFCRFGVAILVWLSFLLKSEVILGLVCLIFLLSAILKVKRAPMIRLCDVTINRIKKAPEVLVDENSIFFAHLVGLFFSLICLALVLFIDKNSVWYSVLILAILKTVAAFGFCPASKLYNCVLNGNCCVNNNKNGTSLSC